MSKDTSIVARNILKTLTPPTVQKASLNVPLKASYDANLRQSKNFKRSFDSFKPRRSKGKTGAFSIPSFLEGYIQKTREEDAFLELVTGRQVIPKSARESARIFEING